MICFLELCYFIKKRTKCTKKAINYVQNVRFFDIMLSLKNHLCLLELDKQENLYFR